MEMLTAEMLRAIDLALAREKEVFMRQLEEMFRPLEERLQLLQQQLNQPQRPSAPAAAG